MRDKPWKKIFTSLKIHLHNFDKSPFIIDADDIKKATRNFSKTTEREVRILCKQDCREDRPKIFEDNGLFLLPINNGKYAIIKGEGYLDIPEIKGEIHHYHTKLDFTLDTSKVGNSEMQHLDFAYASSLIRTFMKDDSLVLTIRGRKYTPEFSFYVNNHKITAKSVQTEVDAGYEGKEQVVLIEAKNTKTSNVIIRQLYYPFRQWQENTKKKVKTLFFEKRENTYHIWLYQFTDIENYNSIVLVDSAKYQIIE